MIAARFLPEAHKHSIAVDADPVALVEKLINLQRVETPKWL